MLTTPTPETFHHPFIRILIIRPTCIHAYKHQSTTGLFYATRDPHYEPCRGAVLQLGRRLSYLRQSRGSDKKHHRLLDHTIFHF